MKYVIAIAVCAVIIAIYAIIGGLLGWKRGGGYLPMLILVGVLGAVWKGITSGDTREERDTTK